MITPELNGGGLWAILPAPLPAFVMLATETSFFKGVPKKDPQKRTDSLVEDIHMLIEP